MMIGGIVGAALLAYIGVTMTIDGDHPVSRILGVVVTLVAGAILFVSIGGPVLLGDIHPDHEVCQSYQWLDETWKCVSKEQAG